MAQTALELFAQVVCPLQPWKQASKPATSSEGNGGSLLAGIFIIFFPSLEFCNWPLSHPASRCCSWPTTKAPPLACPGPEGNPVTRPRRPKAQQPPAASSSSSSFAVGASCQLFDSVFARKCLFSAFPKKPPLERLRSASLLPLAS